MKKVGPGATLETARWLAERVFAAVTRVTQIPRARDDGWIRLRSPALQVRLTFGSEMEKFAEFVSSIGQNARSPSYLQPNAPIPRATAAPNSPPANYVSCDIARQHGTLSMGTQSQAGNVKILFYFVES